MSSDFAKTALSLTLSTISVAACLGQLAACAVDPADNEDNEDWDGDGKADSGLVHQLQSPDRPSLPFECQGTELTAAEVVRQFDPGSSRMLVGGFGNLLQDQTNIRAEIPATIFRQRCNPTTGCSEFAPADGVRPANFAADLEVTRDGVLSLVPRTIGNGPGRVPMTAGDVIYSTINTLARLRITRETNGSMCISVATPVIGGFAGERFFTVGKTELRPPTARSTEGQEPVFPAQTVCDGAPLSDAQVISSFFSPGDASVRIGAQGPRDNWSARRWCHPVTGCTAWAWELFDMLNRHPAAPGHFGLLQSLDAGAAGLSVRTDFHYTYDGAFSTDNTVSIKAPLAAGRFAAGSPIPSMKISVQGKVTASCIGVLVRYETAALDASLGKDVLKQVRSQERITP